MIFKCLHCAKSLEAADDLAGREIACPRCHQKIQIPAPQVSVLDEPTHVEADALPPAAPIPPAPPPVEVAAAPNKIPLRPKTSGMAVTSMVLSIVEIVPGLFCGGFVLSIFGIIFGHIAHMRISRNPQCLSGKGMAIAGFTVGYVGLVIGVTGMLLLRALATTFASSMGDLTKMLPMPPMH